MNLKTSEYNELIDYAEHLMYGKKFCDPGDLVNDAIINICDNISIDGLKKEIRANCVKERKIISGLIRIDDFEYSIVESFNGALFNRASGISGAFRICTKCNNEKPNDEFYSCTAKYSPGIILYHSHCKECDKTYSHSDKRKERKKIRDDKKNQEERLVLREKYKQSDEYKNKTRYRNEYNANLTKEQKESRNKKRRDNSKTPEFRAKRAEAKRKERAKMSNDQKEKAREYAREYYSQLTEEQKQKIMDGRKTPEYRTKTNNRRMLKFKSRDG